MGGDRPGADSDAGDEPAGSSRRRLLKQAAVGGLVWVTPTLVSSPALAQGTGNAVGVTVYRTSSTAQICGGVGSGTAHGTATFELTDTVTVTVTLSLTGLPNGHSYSFYVGQVGCDCPSGVARLVRTPSGGSINAVFSLPRCGSSSEFVLTGQRSNGNHHLHSQLAILT